MTLYRIIHYGPWLCAALTIAAAVTAVQRREHRIRQWTEASDK
jgi:hypothetical protein